MQSKLLFIENKYCIDRTRIHFYFGYLYVPDLPQIYGNIIQIYSRFTTNLCQHYEFYQHYTVTSILLISMYVKIVHPLGTLSFPFIYFYF